MRIGLIDVDSHNFPNLCLMKLSAYHKSRGDIVEWWNGFTRYDLIYMSKVFDDAYTPEADIPCNADLIIRGGTGYDLKNKLMEVVEHSYPDYSLYPSIKNNTAYGFLTRGCPRGCRFCIVSEKEGKCSRKVSDLSDFFRGQNEIKLLDPNLLACKDHEELLQQLAGSGARVDFTQGLDIRLTNKDNIGLLNRIKIKEIHFAWDNPNDSLENFFKTYSSMTSHKPHGRFGTVYCLTNFNTTLKEDLYRIYTLRDLGYDPYVMIYNKAKAPREIRLLQRWVNNRVIFKSVDRFEDFDSRKG